jgi:ABC-2 type transport system permease protein
VRYLLVELRRYASRRAVRASGALVLLGIVIAGVIVFVNSKNGADAVAVVEAERAAFLQNCLAGFEEAPPFLGESPPEELSDPEKFCRDQSLGVVSDPRFHLQDLTDIYGGLSPLLIVLALGLGATFIGSEWGAGTITTYLTWEPRRVRAFVGKAVGALVFVFLAGLAVQLTLGLALTPAGALRGTTEGMDAGWFGDTAIMMIRSATLASIFAGIGFALASAARNTAASIVVGFVYFAVAEQILRAFRPNWARWLVAENAAIWLVGDEAGMGIANSRLRAIATLVAYSTILLGIALALFRKRDVT